MTRNKLPPPLLSQKIARLRFHLRPLRLRKIDQFELGKLVPVQKSFRRKIKPCLRRVLLAALPLAAAGAAAEDGAEAVEAASRRLHKPSLPLPRRDQFLPWQWRRKNNYPMLNSTVKPLSQSLRPRQFLPLLPRSRRAHPRV